jgi:ectoine hydroxylase-related dioxygenase (phytanoyl-CoA dioxygenase family)
MVKAGQASLHDGFLIHGSEPNTSSRRRCGYVIRYVSTSAKPIEDPDKPRSFPCTQLVTVVHAFIKFKNLNLELYNKQKFHK